MSLTGQAKYHSVANTFEHSSSLAKIENLLPQLNFHSKVLDVGCGDARLASLLLPQVGEIYGIDVHKKALTQAKKRGLKTVNTNIEETWPFEDETFDLILLLDIVEHVADCEFVLQEARRILKTNGSIIMTFPNEFDIRSRFEILFGRGIVHWSHRKYEAEAWKYAHIRFLNLSELKSLVKNVNLNISGEQYNFMAGGIIPTKVTPKFIRNWLTKTWPDLFSGKFTFRLSKNRSDGKKNTVIILDKTVSGM